MDINDNIKKRRKLKGYTLEELAKKIGTSKQTIARYENGEIANIPYEKVIALAKALDCTPGFLMGWDKSEPSEETADFLMDIVEDKSFFLYCRKMKLLDEKKLHTIYNLIDTFLGE